MNNKNPSDEKVKRIVLNCKICKSFLHTVENHSDENDLFTDALKIWKRNAEKYIGKHSGEALVKFINQAQDREKQKTLETLEAFCREEIQSIREMGQQNKVFSPRLQVQLVQSDAGRILSLEKVLQEIAKMKGEK